MGQRKYSTEAGHGPRRLYQWLSSQRHDGSEFGSDGGYGSSTTSRVCDLARHIPSLQQLLQSLDREKLDRGVDRLEVSATMPEEYGHFLYYMTGKHGLYEDQRNVGLLRGHIAELRQDDPAAPVVLKNPWDFGHEDRILADFPDSKIVLLRRRLAERERSF